MQRGRQGGRLGRVGLELLLLGFQGLELGEQAGAGPAVTDRIDDVRHLSFDGREVTLASVGLRRNLRGQTLPFGIECRDEVGDVLGLHQLPA